MKKSAKSKCCRESGACMVKPVDHLLYLSVRQQDVAVATVAVSVDTELSDFFHLARTTVIAMPDAAKHLEGREYQSLGEAAFRVLEALSEKGREYLDAFEAYCTGELADLVRSGDARDHIGTATRTVRKGGRLLTSKYSPLLCAMEVKVLSCSDGTGEWLPIGLLLPIVHRDMPDNEAHARLLKLEAEGRQNPVVCSKRRRMRAPGAGGSSGVGGPAGEEAPFSRRVKLIPKPGHCVLVLGEDVPYRIESVFEAEPPAELAGPRGEKQTPSKKHVYVVPIDPSLGEPKMLHVYELVSLSSRYAELQRLHGAAGGALAEALQAAAEQHARATKQETTALVARWMRR